jgi:hypothetical protein
MTLWELSLFWNWIKVTYHNTMWRLGAKFITLCIGDHWEVGIEIGLGPITIWVGYIGR